MFTPKTDQEIERDSTNDNKIKAYNKHNELLSKKSSHQTLTHLGSLKSIAGTQTRFENSAKNFKQRFSKILLLNENTLIDDKIKEDLTYEEKLLLLNDTQPEKIPYFIKGTATYKKLFNLSSGESFGELALIFNQPRSSSIIANEDLHLLCMKSDDYKEVFASEIRNVLDKITFFQRIFKEVPQSEIERFCYLVEEKSFIFNDVICREGDNCKGIYFIKQGTVQVYSI